MMQYLIFSEKPSIIDIIDDKVSSIITPLKNIHLDIKNEDLNEDHEIKDLNLEDVESKINKDNMDLNYSLSKDNDNMDINVSFSADMEIDNEENEKNECEENKTDENINQSEKIDEKPIKIIIGVSGIGKTSHVVSKIFKGYYLIYLSCGDAKRSDFQMYDSNTQSFINMCDTFYYKIVNYVNFYFNIIKKNETDEIEKQKKIRKIMVNYVSYYFLLRLLNFLYLKENLNKNAKEIFFSQINGNSSYNNIILNFIIDDPSFYDEYDFDKLIKKFNYLSKKDIIFAIDELQILATTLCNKFIGRKNTSSLRSLLSIFIESISKFTFLLRYLLG
jgi:hypothetical protein